MSKWKWVNSAFKRLIDDNYDDYNILCNDFVEKLIHTHCTCMKYQFESGNFTSLFHENSKNNLFF